MTVFAIPTLNTLISILFYLLLHGTIEYTGVSTFFECLKFFTLSVFIHWKVANLLSRQIRNRRGQTVVFRLTPTLCIKLLNNATGCHMSKNRKTWNTYFSICKKSGMEGMYIVIKCRYWRVKPNPKQVQYITQMVNA
jgi:hypothetical protein